MASAKRAGKRKAKKTLSEAKVKRQARVMKKLGRMKLWEWILLAVALIIAFLYVLFVLPEMWQGPIELK